MINEFPWIDFLSSIIALCALGVAIWALYYSWEANNISKKSLKHTQEIDSKIKRPFLTLKPQDIQNNFIQYAKINDNTIEFFMTINIKNNGVAIARNISYQCILSINISGQEYSKTTPSPPGSPLSLGPSQDYFYIPKLGIKNLNKDLLEKIFKNLNEEGLKITVDLKANYKDVSLSQDYNVEAIYHLTKRNSYIFKYDSD